ncbi:MAG: type 1 glutamine amidotransferase domain-containing protein [Candidatus Acidiferrales bacterium]
MGGNLAGMKIAILATNGVEEAELVEPRKALDEAGATTVLATPGNKSIQAMKHDEKSETFESDTAIDDLEAEEFDGVLLPGGALNADALRIDKDAQKFVQEIDRAQKPIAVICHGPWLLINAKLTKGRALTSYYTIEDDLVNAGAKWFDEEVVRDRNWVSSRKPSDIPAFNKELLALFSEGSAKSRVATAWR